MYQFIWNWKKIEYIKAYYVSVTWQVFNQPNSYSSLKWGNWGKEKLGDLSNI